MKNKSKKLSKNNKHIRWNMDLHLINLGLIFKEKTEYNKKFMDVIEKKRP